MSADSYKNNKVKKSILEQMTAFLSLIFAVILISVIAIPQVLQALFQLIYYNRRSCRRDIRGKLAIVAGAVENDNELLSLIALRLAMLGCNLVFIGDKLKEEVKLMDKIKNEDVTVEYFSIDTSNVQEVEGVYEFIKQEFGDINMLIYVPKLAESDNFNKEFYNDFNRSFSNMMTLMLSIIDKMKSQKTEGQIVSISPAAGYSVIPDNHPYSAYYSFTKSFNEHIKASELEDKIKISFVQPCCARNGPALTEFISKFIYFRPMKIESIADEIMHEMLTSQGFDIEIPSNLSNLTRLLRYIGIKAASWIIST